MIGSANAGTWPRQGSNVASRRRRGIFTRCRATWPRHSWHSCDPMPASDDPFRPSNQESRARAGDCAATFRNAYETGAGGLVLSLLPATAEAVAQPYARHMRGRPPSVTPAPGSKGTSGRTVSPIGPHWSGGDPGRGEGKAPGTTCPRWSLEEEVDSAFSSFRPGRGHHQSLGGRRLPED
jgi:hypothetical protein